MSNNNNNKAAKMFKEYLTKLVLYFKGLRLYKTEMVPRNPPFVHLVFKTVYDDDIFFNFYKESYEDMVYVRGKTNKKTFGCYIVQAVFDENTPEPLWVYNSLKFMCESWLIPYLDEQLVLKSMVAVYMDYMEKDLRERLK